MPIPYAYSFAIKLGPGDTGLVLTAQLYNQLAAPIGGPVVAGFFEHGGGFYVWDGLIPDRNFRGSVRFYTVGPVIRDVQKINPDYTARNFSGTGAVPVDHDYGGPDELAYKTTLNTGIDNAEIQIYYTADYNAGNRGQEFVVAASRTTVLGRWDKAVMLDPGAYTIIFFKQGVAGPDRKDIVVL